MEGRDSAFLVLGRDIRVLLELVLLGGDVGRFIFLYGRESSGCLADAVDLSVAIPTFCWLLVLGMSVDLLSLLRLVPPPFPF